MRVAKARWMKRSARLSRPRNHAGEQIREPTLQRGLWIFPRAEIMQLTQDFFAPTSRWMWG
jgi:hypothetical protein